MQSSVSRQKKTTSPKPTTAKAIPTGPRNEDRRTQIATAAYHKAEVRNFEPGYELEDWLTAEAEEK